MKSDTSNTTILVVEDDPNTVSLVKACLSPEGFKIIPAYDGEKALLAVNQYQPILIILDLQLPKVDGLEVCQQLRKSSDIPILMLTGRAREDDKVLGLNSGADDYLVKPFSPRELVARVKALLRRALPQKPPTERTFSFKGIELSLTKRNVTVRGQNVSLTPNEFRLLETLMAAPGHVFSRETLLDQIHGFDGVNVVGRTIDVYIGKLRDKLERNPSKPEYIFTVRGFGYKFSEV